MHWALDSRVVFHHKVHKDHKGNFYNNIKLFVVFVVYLIPLLGQLTTDNGLYSVSKHGAHIVEGGTYGGGKMIAMVRQNIIIVAIGNKPGFTFRSPF